MNTLTTYLGMVMNTVYSDTDTDWVNFVTDHKLIIRDSANKYKLSADKMATVKYDMLRLLTDISFPLGASWIIYIINDFSSDMEFVSQDSSPVTLYVPDLSTQLPKLYTYYQSSKNSVETSS